MVDAKRALRIAEAHVASKLREKKKKKEKREAEKMQQANVNGMCQSNTMKLR